MIQRRSSTGDEGYWDCKNPKLFVVLPNQIRDQASSIRLKSFHQLNEAHQRGFEINALKRVEMNRPTHLMVHVDVYDYRSIRKNRLMKLCIIPSLQIQSRVPLLSVLLVKANILV